MTEPASALRDRILATPDLGPAWSDVLAASEHGVDTAKALAGIVIDAHNVWAESTRGLLSSWSGLAGPLRENAERLTSASHFLTSELRATQSVGRSESLARLGAETRALAKGNAALSVRVVRVLTHLEKSGKHYTAAIVALALRGDVDALQAVADMHAKGDPLACIVLSILADLEDLTARVENVLDEIAATLASDLLTADQHDDAPPPRRARIGTAEPHSPPLALLCASGYLSSLTTATDAERATPM